MKRRHYSSFIFCFLFLLVIPVHAEDWRDKTELLIYSPRYFGPNGFPIPELHSGKISQYGEAEVRGEYHYFSGDKTGNLYARLFIPFVRGRAGVDVSVTAFEKYKMTPETRDERNAVETESPITCQGDVIIGAYFQVLTSEKWVDAMFNFTLKTASGGRLCDARYTDAAAYWFDLAIGRDLIKDKGNTFSLRAQMMGGFYCWMTNDMVHRQNDAILFGAGLTGKYRYFTLSTDLSGFNGYKNNGDTSLSWRNNLRFEYKKNVISARYNIGLKDRLYDTLSLAYIRCF